jgi:hypothetical protein
MFISLKFFQLRTPLHLETRIKILCQYGLKGSLLNATTHETLMNLMFEMTLIKFNLLS